MTEGLRIPELDYSLRGAKDFADLQLKANARINELKEAWRECQQVASEWSKRAREHGLSL